MIPAAALTLIPSLFQLGTGLAQNIRGRRELNALEQPQYRRPGEVDANVTLAAQAYGDPMTAAQSQAANAIGQSSANAIAAAQQSGGGAALAPLIASQESNARLGLAAQMDNTKQQQMGTLASMLATRGDYKDKEWQMNEFAPYKDKFTLAQQQIGGGQQNIFDALGGLSSVGAMFLSNKPAEPPATVAGPQNADAVQYGANMEGKIRDYTKQGMNMMSQYGPDMLLKLQQMLRNAPMGGI